MTKLFLAPIMHLTNFIQYRINLAHNLGVNYRNTRLERWQYPQLRRYDRHEDPGLPQPQAARHHLTYSTIHICVTNHNSTIRRPHPQKAATATPGHPITANDVSWA